MVADANPPSPLVTSHSRGTRGSSPPLPIRIGSIMQLQFFGRQNERGPARNLPNPVRGGSGDALPAVARRLARPQQPPAPSRDRREQRFRERHQRQFGAEIDDQYPVPAVAGEISQDPGIIGQDRTLDLVGSL